MARRRSRTKQILSAASELRKGFTIPTHSKIRTALRSKSKAFVISLFLTAFSMLPKGKKLKLLIKIERGIGRIRHRRRTKTRRRRRTTKRKTRRRTTRRRTRRGGGRKKRRSAAQRRNDKRLGKRAKARAKARRRR